MKKMNLCIPFRYTLDRPKLRCLVQDGDRNDTKLLLLDEELKELTGESHHGIYGIAYVEILRVL